MIYKHLYINTFLFLHKYAILGGGVPVLLNKHFLTKDLTLNICILKKVHFLGLHL